MIMSYPLLEVKKHLSSEELKARYMNCADGVERSHWHVLWLVGRNKDRLKASEAADVTGFSVDWIRKLIRRFNREGPTTIGDKRKNNGKSRVLSEADQKQLLKELQQEPEDKGLWTGPKVALWISKKINRRVHAATGWRYLQRLGFSLQRPRPQHQKVASKEEQREFKKNSRKK